MENAKEEFIKQSNGKEVLCALITHGADYDDDRSTHVLKSGFSESEYATFLGSLDFMYDAGFGGQKLFGNIWYKDGTWSERGECDGSEWWELKTMPEIPKECATEIVEQNQN